MAANWLLVSSNVFIFSLQFGVYTRTAEVQTLQDEQQQRTKLEKEGDDGVGYDPNATGGAGFLQYCIMGSFDY